MSNKELKELLNDSILQLENLRTQDEINHFYSFTFLDVIDELIESDYLRDVIEYMEIFENFKISKEIMSTILNCLKSVDNLAELKKNDVIEIINDTEIISEFSLLYEKAENYDLLDTCTPWEFFWYIQDDYKQANEFIENYLNDDIKEEIVLNAVNKYDYYRNSNIYHFDKHFNLIYVNRLAWWGKGDYISTAI